jgi:catechol 2,3-dioxygenase-like lactoylglutathione lyase family enzyme
MQVLGIDHVNLRAGAPALEALRAFYCDVLGLEHGDRPPFETAGYWLYAGGRPVVHLAEAAPDGEANTARARFAVGERHQALDHIAFRCSGLAEMVERLVDKGVPYAVRVVPLARQLQVLIEDPAGTRIELIFSERERSEQQPSQSATRGR